MTAGRIALGAAAILAAIGGAATAWADFGVDDIRVDNSSAVTLTLAGALAGLAHLRRSHS